MILDVLSFFNGDWFNGFINDVILRVLAFIPQFVYFFVTCLLSIGDFFQVVFRKLAGLDPVMYAQDVEVTTGDTLYKLLTDSLLTTKYPALTTAFWAFIILGIFLLFIFTIAAVIRIEYMPDKEKGNSKTGIMKNFFSALATFAAVPIATLFGLYIGNQLISVLDQMTSSFQTQNLDVQQYYDMWTPTNDNELINNNNTSSYYSYAIFGLNIPTSAEPFSGMIFKASAYNSNRFRVYGGEYFTAMKNSNMDFGFIKDGSVIEPELAAKIVDVGFGMNAKMKNAPDNGYNIDYTNFDHVKYANGQWSSGLFGKYDGIKSFDKYNVTLVWLFYNLWTFNFIIAFASVASIVKLYYNFCLMLMARVFEVFGLFLLAPVTTSLLPLDNGEAMKRWRKQFIGRYIIMYSMVFAMNMLSPLLAVIQQIKFFNLAILDYFVYTFFIIAGLNAVNSIAKSMVGIVFEKGGEIYEGSMGTAAKIDESFRSGVSQTVNAGAMGARIGTTAVRIGAWGVGQGVRAIARGNERRAMGNTRAVTNQQRNQVQTDLNYMNGKQRAQEADDLAATQAGRDLINSQFGGDARAFRTAMANNSFASPAQQQAVMDAMVERNRFESTAAAQGLERGSAAYNAAFNQFNSANERQRQNELLGRAPITDAQARIQNRRAAVRNFAGTVANVYGNIAGRVRPVVGATARNLSGILGNLPIIGGAVTRQLNNGNNNGGGNGGGGNGGGGR